jgi:hypothetical protein
MKRLRAKLRDGIVLVNNRWFIVSVWSVIHWRPLWDARNIWAGPFVIHFPKEPRE